MEGAVEEEHGSASMEEELVGREEEEVGNGLDLPPSPWIHDPDSPASEPARPASQCGGDRAPTQSGRP